jgi:Phage-related lysozyme (muraminidase)
MTTFDFIKEEEGFREKPYLDTLGVPTFGIGFTYITEEEADWILAKRLSEIETELRVKYRWYDNLNATRQDVIISMVYQLGFGGIAKFKKFIAAMERKDYDTAAVEMLDSLWARQTPNRAKRQAYMIKNG